MRPGSRLTPWVTVPPHWAFPSQGSSLLQPGRVHPADSDQGMRPMFDPQP